MSKQKYECVEVFWWVSSDGPRLQRYTTRQAGDIEYFGDSHFRLTAHPFEASDYDLDLILRWAEGLWRIKSDRFYTTEEYPIAFSLTDEGAVWTSAHADEVMVVRAVLESTTKKQ